MLVDSRLIQAELANLTSELNRAIAAFNTGDIATFSAAIHAANVHIMAIEHWLRSMEREKNKQ